MQIPGCTCCVDVNRLCPGFSCCPVLRNIFLVSCVLLACSALFPVLWHLWIYAGSANSNFYYAITLLFNVAQVGRSGPEPGGMCSWAFFTAGIVTCSSRKNTGVNNILDELQFQDPVVIHTGSSLRGTL